MGGCFYIPFTSMDRLFRQKISRKNTALKWHIRPHGLLIYETLHPKVTRIHILNTRVHNFYKCTWNILQDILHSRPQNKPWYILKNWICIKHLPIQTSLFVSTFVHYVISSVFADSSPMNAYYLYHSRILIQTPQKLVMTFHHILLSYVSSTHFIPPLLLWS